MFEKKILHRLDLPLGLLLILLFQHVGFDESLLRAASPFNTRQRELWTSGNVQGSPDPADPYSTQSAFPRLQLFEPLSVGLVPGSNKFGVATRPGKIFTVNPQAAFFVRKICSRP